ncbi:ABC transporter permease [Virgibacillus natechei]
MHSNSLNVKGKLTHILQNHGALIGLLLLCLFFSLASDGFFTSYNLLSLGRQSAVYIILAIGMTYVILTGGIDLSVGAIAALVGTITAGLLADGFSLLVSLFAGLTVGTLFGLFNGFLVTKAKIPPFVATLASLVIARSLALIYSQGYPISGLPDNFAYIGSGYIGPIPFPVILTIIIFLIGLYVLNSTIIGRYIYSIGGNEEASYLSGINVHKWKIIIYGINGFLIAIAGILLAARMNSGQPNAADGMELDIIAAVVIGGTSLMGGRGKLIGTLYGALIITVLDNGLNLMNVSSFYQGSIIGIVILLAVWLDQRKKDQ